MHKAFYKFDISFNHYRKIVSIGKLQKLIQTNFLGNTLERKRSDIKEGKSQTTYTKF